MPCDEEDECPYPGKPGYDGALDPENVELAELFKHYKALGAWAIELELRQLSGTQAAEVTHILYEMEIENTRLKGIYPDVCMLWDPEPVQGE